MTERFTTDDRGVSEVIGAILVFGLLISLIAVMQTFAIPAANQEVEFNHNLEAQTDLVDFHERTTRVALQGSGESVSVQAGTSYPSRLLFFNPPNPAGTLQTSESRQATIRNVSATEPEVDEYLDGSTLQLDSRTFEYTVNYNEYQSPPTTRYEYGVLYNVHQNATLNQNPGSVVDGTNINLVFMAGNYSRTSSRAQSVDIQPVSAPARPVTVTGESGNNVTLILPTQMSVNEWENLYEDQNTVLGIRDGPSPDTVRIDLDGSETYTLRMARIGLEQGVQRPGAHYIVPADDGVSTIGAGDNATVKYEVRDEYNNPVSGVDVTTTLPSGGTVTNKTDGEGRVTQTVSPGSPTSVTAEIDSCAPPIPARCEADFRVEVTDLNPNPSSGVSLTDVNTVDVNLAGITLLGDDTFEFDLNSSSSPKNISKFRINHYHEDAESRSPAVLEDSSGNRVEDIEIGGEFITAADGVDQLDPVGTSDTTYYLGFEDTVENNHFAVVTIIYEDGDRALYFISET